MHHARRPVGPVAAAKKLRHLCPLVGYSEGREIYSVKLYAAVRLAVVDEASTPSFLRRRAGTYSLRR